MPVAAMAVAHDAATAHTGLATSYHRHRHLAVFSGPGPRVGGWGMDIVQVRLGTAQEARSLGDRGIGLVRSAPRALRSPPPRSRTFASHHNVTIDATCPPTQTCNPVRHTRPWPALALSDRLVIGAVEAGAARRRELRCGLCRFDDSADATHVLVLHEIAQRLPVLALVAAHVHKHIV